MPSNRIYVLVLIDHKSSEEPHVLVQMLGYIVRIWENALENKQPLLPIIPWVVCNGVSPWRTARSLDQLIPVPESWKRYVLLLHPIPTLHVSAFLTLTQPTESESFDAACSSNTNRTRG